MQRTGHFSAWDCCGCHQLYHCSSPSILSLELVNARAVPNARHNHLAELWAGYPLQFIIQKQRFFQKVRDSLAESLFL